MQPDGALRAPPSGLWASAPAAGGGSGFQPFLEREEQTFQVFHRLRQSARSLDGGPENGLVGKSEGFDQPRNEIGRYLVPRYGKLSETRSHEIQQPARLPSSEAPPPC